MVPRSQTGWLGPLAFCLLIAGIETISKNFVNSSMPEMRPTFVVNFDMATVICQHSAESTDLHLHEISVLCDGKNDCYQNPAMHDESFPYCERKCNSTCSDRGACLYDGQKPQCYCNSGFSGPMCEIVDKNECLDKPCHWLAHCQNTLGSYECACFPGFHGDGYHCADIDECSMSKYSCPENSVCVNLPGTYFCNCTEGFAPKGLPLEKCADINECEMNLHNCGESQMCQNTIGGYNCVDRCSQGYEFLDGECVDIDECRLENVCDPRAQCINTPGDFQCSCDAGLTGDGHYCEPITDCSQQEDICDRHAFCIKSLKLCLCQTGYVGDGITCNDVNECATVESPCANQTGHRCVNINGGYICCDEDVDDDRCIKEKGAFCAGGCGLHAVCYNQTCQCMEGFVGDPHTRCIDVNECESDNMCAGVGEWCVNKMGGHLCCSSESEEPECQGMHVFKTHDGEVLLEYNATHGDILIHESKGSWRNDSGGQSVITRHGFLKGEGLFPTVNVNRKNELMCTSYCPANSECVEGVCRCSKGFGGNPLFGCEDIDECVTNDPCPKEKYTWCVNSIGGYHCCTPESLSTDCIGLEIAAGPDGGLKLIGLGKEGETFLAAPVNETTTGQTISESVHEVRNFSGGEILVVKNKIKSDVFDTKPTEGEVGLEISGSDASRKISKETFPLPTSNPLEFSTSGPVITVTLPGVISTLGGASTFTTSIPITEIPVHGISSTITARPKNGSSPVVEIDGSGVDFIDHGVQRQTTLTTLTMTEETGSGEEPTASIETATIVAKQNRKPVDGAEAASTTEKPYTIELTVHEDEDLTVTAAASTDAAAHIAISGEEGSKEGKDEKPEKSGTTSGTSTAPISSTTSLPAIGEDRTHGPDTSAATTSEKSSTSPSGTTTAPISALTPSPTTETKLKSESETSGNATGSGSVPPSVNVEITTDKEGRNPMIPKENEQGLEISFRPTGTPSAGKTTTRPKTAVDQEGSGEEPSDSVVSNKGNLTITVTTATDVPNVEKTTLSSQTIITEIEEHGSSGSISSRNKVSKIAGERPTVGAAEATTTPEPVVDGDNVGLEIVHEGRGEKIVTTTELGLEIGPVEKATDTPSELELVTESEPDIDREDVDGKKPPEGTTKGVTTPKDLKELGGSTPEAPKRTDDLEGSGETPAVVAPGSTTEQPDLVLTAETTTHQPDLVLSMETTKAVEVTTATTTTKDISKTTAGASSKATPEITIDESGETDAEKGDSHSGKKKTTKVTTSPGKAESTTPKMELTKEPETTDTKTSTVIETTTTSGDEKPTSATTASATISDKTDTATPLPTTQSKQFRSEPTKHATESTSSPQTSSVPSTSTEPTSKLPKKGTAVTDELPLDAGKTSATEEPDTKETEQIEGSGITDTSGIPETTTADRVLSSSTALPPKTTSEQPTDSGKGKTAGTSSESLPITSTTTSKATTKLTEDTTTSATTSGSESALGTTSSATEQAIKATSEHPEDSGKSTSSKSPQPTPETINMVSNVTTATPEDSGSSGIPKLSKTTQDVVPSTTVVSAEPLVTSTTSATTVLSGRSSEGHSSTGLPKETSRPQEETEASTPSSATPTTDITNKPTTALERTSTGDLGESTSTSPTSTTELPSKTSDKQPEGTQSTSTPDRLKTTSKPTNVAGNLTTASPEGSGTPAAPGSSKTTFESKPSASTLTAELTKEGMEGSEGTTKAAISTARTAEPTKEGKEGSEGTTKAIISTEITKEKIVSTTELPTKVTTEPMTKDSDSNVTPVPQAIKGSASSTVGPLTNATSESLTTKDEGSNASSTKTPPAKATSEVPVTEQLPKSPVDAVDFNNTKPETKSPKTPKTTEPTATTGSVGNALESTVGVETTSHPESTKVPSQLASNQSTTKETTDDSDLLGTTAGTQSTTTKLATVTPALGSTGASSTQPSTAKTPKTEFMSSTTSATPSSGLSSTTKTKEAPKQTPSTQHPTAGATIIPEFPEGSKSEFVDGKQPTGAPSTTLSTVTAGPSSGSTTVSGNTVPKGAVLEGLPSTPKQHREPVTETEEFATDTLPTKDTFVLTTVPTTPAAALGPSNTTKCTSGDQCGDDAYCERRTGACRCYPGFEGAPPMVGCKDVDECATGLHKCDLTARCHNYVGGYACFCPMGYRKMDKGICVDIDECTESQGGCCSGNATCINKEGSYGCKCNEGFVGDGYKCMPVEKRGCTEAEWADANCGKNHMCTVDSKGKKDCDMCKMGFEMKNGECVDINECASPGLNMCDKNAVCNNLMGTYACQCKKGFRGDGYMCDDEDECRTMPCHPQAECHNVPGSFQCKCPEGFEGDGVKTCVNPLENSCKDMERLCGRTEHTACLSVRLFDGSLGSICECEPNYRYNNVTHQCEDIDECAENRHNCDPASSTCVNEDGGFRCECYEGYEGTGGVCVDIDECERGVAGCHSMAMCINQPGSCGCKCVHGFTGDGTQCNAMKRETDNTCTPEWQRLCKKENRTCHVDDEDVPQCGSCIEGHQLVNGTCHQIESGGVCSDPTKNNCDVNAECIDVRPGRHFCTCKVGYIGDGMRCDDIDECSLAGICDPHATCHNSPGSFNCTCNPGYVGNGHVCEAIDTTNGTKTTPRPNCHLDARLCHANAECMADGNCKCRHGYEGDGIQNCTEITTTTTAFTSTTLSTLSISSVPRSTGAITEIDENEVVELITGDTQRKTTALKTSSTGLGKPHSEGGSSVGFQTSTVEPSSSTFPLTTDHHRNHTTITDSIRSSTIIHTTPLIHESSTKPSETDSSSASTVSGIEITKSSFVTTSNLPSDGAKQKTTTVDTNQPHETHELTSEESFITELGSVEVTQAMIVLPKTSPKPSQVSKVPDDSTESPILTDEGVLLSRVFQRESTTSHTPTLSFGSTPLFTLSSDSSSNTEDSGNIESTTNTFITSSIAPSSAVEATTDGGITEAGSVQTSFEESVTSTTSQVTSEQSPFPTPKGLSSEEVTGPPHRATSNAPTYTSHPLTEEGSGEAQLATIESHTSETTTPSDDNVSLSLSSTEATLSQKTPTSKAPVTSEEPFTEEQTSTRGKYTEENLLSSSETPVVASAEFTEEISETSTIPVEVFVASSTREETTFTSSTGFPSSQTTELSPTDEETSKFRNATTEPVLVSSGTPDFTGDRTSELSTLEVETSATFATTPSKQSSRELSIHSSTTPKSEEDSGLTTATATPSGGESGKISSTRAVEETHSSEGEETSQATTVSPFDVSTPEKSDAGLLNRFTSSTKAFARESTPKADNTTDEPLLTSSETSKAVSSEFTETTQEISTFEVETSVATKRGFRVNATSTDHLIKSSTTPIPKELLELTNGTEVTPSSNGSGISPTSKESSETLERKGNVSRPPLKSIEVTTIPTATEPTRLTGIPQEPLVEGLTSPKVTLIIHETTGEGLGSTESWTTSSGLKTTAEPGSFVEENVTTPEGPRPSTDRNGTTRIPLTSSGNVSATSPSNTTSEEVGQHSTEYTTTPSSAFSSPTSTDNDSFKSTAISESTPGASDTKATSTSAPPNVTQQKEEPRTTSESTTGEGFQATITSKPESGTTSSEKVEGTSTTVSERTDESVTDDQSKTTVEMPSTVINPEVTTAAPGDLSSNTVKSTSTLISTTTYETVSQQQSTTIVDESATTDTTSTSQATTSGTSSTTPVETSGTTSSKPSFEFQTTGGERSTTSAPSDATSPTVSTRKDTTGDLTSSPTGPTQPIVTVTPKEDHTNTTINVATTTAPSSPKSSTASTTVSSTSKPELHSTTEDDLKVVVESFESTSAPTGEVQVTNRRCSSIDRSMCHELAICEVATGSCRCKDGFAGDGYTNCTKFVRPDCVSDPTVCHGNASCDHHTRQCSCNLGHIGDGFVCNPDPQDCVLRKDLCSPEALCIGRRCRCVEGFTGDGIKCVSLYQRSVNCSECDTNAHCNDGMCQCNVGYFGNGLCCVPDPRDCVHFSGVCHPDATCDRDERACKCNTGFLGDGISCFPVRSCRSDPNVCDVEAICLPSGQCICKHGFRGNGYNCIKISPLLRHQSNEPLNSCMNSCDRETELCISGNCVCKHGYEQRKDGKCVDVNECLSSPCHHLATCTNLLGSFACTCPDGYAGDGKTCIQHLKIGELGVFCEPDGMTLVLGNETTAFEGRIFVRGQAENPYCAKTFSSLQHASKPYMFKVPFEHCNVRLEDQDTFATTVIVQKHPMFITTAADAYDLRCTYPVGVREVESNVNVSDLTTSSTLTDNAHGPSCRLTVTNEADESIAAAVVGQALRLRLEVMPNETYSILPRNCFAINIETGDRYSLTDKAGCAIDDQLFPEWTKIRPSLTEAVFRTFKWPDSSMIRFQCDCSACVGNCPEMNCGRRREAAMRRFRFRRVRDIKNGSAIEERPTDFDYDEDEEEKELLKKIIDPKRLAFSSLVRVREDEEEERAQQQVDHWRNGVTMESETIKELVTQEAAVCLRTVLVFGAMAVTCFCVVVLIYISIRRRRCKAITMQESVSTIGL